MAYRLGVDVGGTFTDLLLIDERTGDTYRAKTASTPDDQSVGVLRGIERVRGSAGITLGDIATGPAPVSHEADHASAGFGRSLPWGDRPALLMVDLMRA